MYAAFEHIAHTSFLLFSDGFSPIRIMRRSLGIAHASCKKMRSVMEKLKAEFAGFVPETPPSECR